MSCSPVLAEESERILPRINFKITKWYSEADASWQKSFSNSSGGTTESELNYNDINSDITIFEAKIKATDIIAISFNFGSGEITNAKGMDTDRSTGVGTFALSEFDVDGKTRMWGGNIYARLLPGSPDLEFTQNENIPDKLWLDIFSGYQHYEDKLHMFNGSQIVPARRPIRNLNSTYNFKWNYFQIGLQSGWYIIKPSDTQNHGLEISGLFAYIPFAQYDGRGVWNLRSDFRQDPSFHHQGTGRGLDANLALSYIYKKIKLSVGYRYFALDAKNGDDTIYLADGTQGRDTLDRVEVKRDGPFASVTLSF